MPSEIVYASNGPVMEQPARALLFICKCFSIYSEETLRIPIIVEINLLHADDRLVYTITKSDGDKYINLKISEFCNCIISTNKSNMR
jgi:hypothetical protein